jgi:hypothetical protein
VEVELNLQLGRFETREKPGKCKTKQNTKHNPKLSRSISEVQYTASCSVCIDVVKWVSGDLVV